MQRFTPIPTRLEDSKEARSVDSLSLDVSSLDATYKIYNEAPGLLLFSSLL